MVLGIVLLSACSPCWNGPMYGQGGSDIEIVLSGSPPDQQAWAILDDTVPSILRLEEDSQCALAGTSGWVEQASGVTVEHLLSIEEPVRHESLYTHITLLDGQADERSGIIEWTLP